MAVMSHKYRLTAAVQCPFRLKRHTERPKPQRDVSGIDRRLPASTGRIDNLDRRLPANFLTADNASDQHVASKRTASISRLTGMRGAFSVLFHREGTWRRYGCGTQHRLMLGMSVSGSHNEGLSGLPCASDGLNIGPSWPL